MARKKNFTLVVISRYSDRAKEEIEDELLLFLAFLFLVKLVLIILSIY